MRHTSLSRGNNDFYTTAFRSVVFSHVQRSPVPKHFLQYQVVAGLLVLRRLEETTTKIPEFGSEGGLGQIRHSC